MKMEYKSHFWEVFIFYVPLLVNYVLKSFALGTILSSSIIKQSLRGVLLRLNQAESTGVDSLNSIL